MLAAFVAGLASSPLGLHPAFVAAPLVLAVAGALGYRNAAVLAAAATIVGAGAGVLRLEALDDGSSRVRPGPLAATAHLLERPRAARFGSAATLRVADGPFSGLRLHARAPPGVAWPRGITVGSELVVRGTLRSPGGPGGTAGNDASGGFDLAAHLRRRGVAGVLDLRAVRASGRQRRGIPGAIDAVRERAERSIAAGIGPERGALARGLVLGQDEAIGPLARDDWRDSGLAHLLAASGQNVMLLCALALPLLTFAGAGQALRVVVLLALVAMYVPLAGAGPSIVRAGVMAAAGLAALAAARPASRAYALLLAAAVTLLLNPRGSGEPGWQLSFAAVAGIALLARPLAQVTSGGSPAAGRLSRAVVEAAAVTIAATLATLPLVSLHFGEVPLVAVPANLAAFPAVAPVMWLGTLRGVLGQVEPLPLAGAVNLALGPPLDLLLRYLGAVAGGAATLADPVALSLGTTGAAAAGLALAAFAVALRRAAAAGEAATPARRRPVLPFAAGAALLAVVLPSGALREGPRVPADGAVVSFLDVGQGDATLVRDGSGAALLFDGGPPEARVARLLARAGVRRLDLLVATHPSRDHHGGLREVVRRVPVRVLLDGGDGTRDAAFRAVLAAARRRGTRVVPATAGVSLRLGALHVRVLSPPPRPPGPPPPDPNPRAVVALVSRGGFDLLLSADAESDALLPLELPDVDAFKVPHHGSADPGLPELLGRLRPQVAAIEVGAGNPFGHPAPGTLAALRKRVPRVYRTDRDGTIHLTSARGALRVETER